MSLGNWLSRPPIGVGLAVILLLAFAGLLNHQRDRYCANQSAADHCQNAFESRPEGAVESRITKPPPANPKPERNEWREEQDLEAQQDMAFWAMLMFVAAIVSVGVTGLGVYYVKHTLDATRNTSAVQLRAYIVVESKHRFPEIQPVDGNPANAKTEPMITIRNVGLTPAYSVAIYAQTYITPPLRPNEFKQYGDKVDLTKNRGPIITIGPGTETTLQVINNNLTRKRIDLVRGGRGRLMVAGKIVYRTLNNTVTLRFYHVYTGIGTTARDVQNQEESSP